MVQACSIPGSLMIKRFEGKTAFHRYNLGTSIDGTLVNLEDGPGEPFFRDKMHEETQITPQKVPWIVFLVHGGSIPEAILCNVLRFRCRFIHPPGISSSGIREILIVHLVNIGFS